MDSNAFTECMGMLEEHHGKKLKEPRFYWDDLKGLPADAMRDMCKGWIRNHGPTPGNFPTIQALQEEWQAWLKKHPHRQEVIRWEFCEYCEPDSPGLILIRIPLEKPIYRKEDSNYRETVVRCKHCNNGQYRNPTWPRYTVEDIQARGWTVVTKRHRREDDSDLRVPRPSEKRVPEMTHIEKCLPVGDRDDGNAPLYRREE